MTHHHHTHRRRVEPLPQGAGAGGCLFLDCPSGAAGDMLVASLLDLGVPRTAIEQALAELPIEGYRLEVGSAQHHAISATTFTVRIEEPATEERSHREIDAMLASASLATGVATLARAIFRRLAEAEAQVHGTTIEEVVFHEVGAVDSIVDIVAVAAALRYLGGPEVVASPLPLGRGWVHARHGHLPLPAPATVYCLRGVPTYGVDLDEELVTPTGAAVVAVVASRFVRWPDFVLRHVGYGAGARHFAQQPNILRSVLGVADQDRRMETQVVIEANTDDMSGELAAHAMQALFEAGALDAWATPVLMKKGRPGLQIAALAPADRSGEVARALLRESTTIGLRQFPVRRIERSREVVPVSTRFGRLPVKVSGGEGEPPQVKPEFDACAAAAREHGVPVRIVLAEVLARYAQRSGP